jgi:Na+-transporting methylmalonyl-CoA/oxaloacetate decarboxylase gamma subunit
METSVSAHFTGFSGGILMSVIAFSIVFLVCIGLMLMMMALKHISAAVGRANAEKECKTAPPAAAVPAAAAVPTASAVTAEDDDEEEIVAVIMAAISASCGASAKITSIRPAQPRAASSAWRMTGILQNAEGLSESY